MVYFAQALNYINQNTERFKNRPGMIAIAKGVVYGNKAEVLILKGETMKPLICFKKASP